ncbi:hypothetical protein NOR_07753 [Metarhizium rileyi]|uniref:Uncharacterized protein n=1 Tax=Metarhizium rileyi (strain RCEF 4871) TaxID=1649241 RepID=A0A166S388_METRR|nr:hypothetical protein NOR_07753 [Metarhizium rileyi RCEF 4871]TWU71122.1 hypothetical protein ED733_001988 [Metarhizium rileyi]
MKLSATLLITLAATLSQAGPRQAKAVSGGTRFFAKGCEYISPISGDDFVKCSVSKDPQVQKSQQAAEDSGATVKVEITNL